MDLRKLRVSDGSQENSVCFTPVYTLDPLRDRRWEAFLSRHPRASVFHSRGWLEALARTYGYEPVVYTTSPPGEPLTNGIAFCRVNSWLTGNRMVSLPFSDHCEPLVDEPGDSLSLSRHLEREVSGGKIKYVELRPVEVLPVGFLRSDAEKPVPRKHASFQLHTIDLHPAAKEIFDQFHKSCIQRKIQRAERETLSYEQGRSAGYLAAFYALLRKTRHRHGVPPQPLAWFQNLIATMEERLTIHVARKQDRPIATLLTLNYKNTLTYKYGCSDDEFHNLGGVPFLFWNAIRQARSVGIERFDLGRTELDNAGLISFKEHLGASSSTLTYYRYAKKRSPATIPASSWLRRTVLARLPQPLLDTAGTLLYRHIG